MVPELDEEAVRLGDSRRMNLSFAGCGFLGIYHVGVASCFKEYAPHLVADKISGASAGALAATALITGCCLGECTSYTLRIAAKARARSLGPLHPSFNLVQILREGLDDFFPDNAHKIASGRLHVSMTRVSDRENVIISEFDSKEDLIQALVCSSFVPFYCGLLPPKYKGVRYVDGGLSDNIPVLDENTVTVSPFAGESDICPTDISSNGMHIHVVNTSIQFTMGNLYRCSHAFFPPHPEVLARMCKQGFDDALKFLQKNSLLSCTRHLSIQSSIVANQPISSKDEDDYEEEEEEEEEVDSYPEEQELVHHKHHSMEECVECRQQHHVAVMDSLPPSVLSALQAACDSVNSGLLSPIYNLRAFKVISLMAAPWILPIDVVLEAGRRVYEWVPYMPNDMQWFGKEFAMMLSDIVYFLKHGRHKYSARFTCQLAITELDYDQDHILSAPSSPYLRRSHKPRYAPSRRRNLNMGFSVDFQSRHKQPLRCVDELRHQIVDEGHVDSSRASSRRSSRSDLEIQEEFMETVEINEEIVDRKSDELQNVDYDTISNCLHIANQMESVLSFYYSEEDNPNIVKVTEIFAMDEAHGMGPEACEMSWDSYIENQSSNLCRDSSSSEEELGAAAGVSVAAS